MQSRDWKGINVQYVQQAGFVKFSTDQMIINT